MPVERMKAKIALVGDAGVGKTSLIRRFVLDEFDDRYLHTIGTKVMKVQLTIPHGADMEVRMDLSIFDIVGQKGFRDMVKETFFHDAQGLLAVCDLTNHATLESLNDWIATALESSGHVPIYILANKHDLQGRATFGDEAAAKVAKRWDAAFIHTSAKTGEFVDEAFNSLAIEIVNDAFRALQARSSARDLENRILETLAVRGLRGLSKDDLVGRFRGIGYEELRAAIERLGRKALVQINWKGAEDFSALITPRGTEAVRDAMSEAERAKTLPSTE